MGIEMFETIIRKGWRGSVAVHAAALGCDPAGRRAEHGIPEPKGKQCGRRLIPVLQVSESMKRSEFHV